MEINLGVDEHGNPEQTHDQQFRHHKYLRGLGGTGKSTEMANILLQVIAGGDGAILFDPIGDASSLDAHEGTN